LTFLTAVSLVLFLRLKITQCGKQSDSNAGDAFDRIVNDFTEHYSVKKERSGMTQTASGNITAQQIHHPCFVACMGDANHPDVWSATPYHFIQSARAAGVVDGGLTLRPHLRKFKTQRLVWNAWNVLTGKGRGGYQYSPSFLEALWRPVRDQIRNATVISMYQLIPDSVIADKAIRKMFYVDGTLRQLADYYQVPVSASTTDEAIIRERRGYESAEAIFTMSSFAAESVVNDYGIDRSKVCVAPPGANLGPELYGQWVSDQLKNGRKTTGALKMVTIAKDWKRKGVDRLLRAMEIGRTQGLQATLRVIGCNAAELPAELQRVPGVEWYGFLSRRGQERKFLDVVAECNLGCLLSTAEMAGIALREYLALGIPSLGSDTGGCRDMMEPDSSLVVSQDASDAQIAAILLELERNQEKFKAMQDAAWRDRERVLWSESVKKIQRFVAAKA